jgi:hypothetical protein
MNDLVNVPDSTSLNITGPLSIVLWLYNNTATGNRFLLIKGNQSTIGYSFWITSSGTNVQFATYNGVSNPCQSGSGYTDLNAWNFIAVTYDGSQAQHYKNGVARTTCGSIPNPSSSAGNAVRIGGYNSTVGTGYLDDVRIYNRALSAAEIQAIYNATK